MVHFHFGEGELQDCERLQNVLHNSYLRDIAKICKPCSTSQYNLPWRRNTTWCQKNACKHSVLQTLWLVVLRPFPDLWKNRSKAICIWRCESKCTDMVIGCIMTALGLLGIGPLSLWVGLVALQIFSCRVEKNRDWWPKQVMIFCLYVSADKQGGFLLYMNDNLIFWLLRV